TREALEKCGYRVLGATISAKAAKELKEGASIESMTIASLEFRMDPGTENKLKHHAKQIFRAALKKPTFQLEPLTIDNKTVLVLDEAAMISTKELMRLFSTVEKAGGMLITVFDRKQLQAIGPGGGAAFLADRHGKAELTNIVRQKSENDVTAVKSFS